MSRRGLCAECGTSAQLASVRQLAEHRGPIFDHWRARMAGSVGASPPPHRREPLTGDDEAA